MAARLSIANELRELRQARRLSLRETSALAEISRPTLANWEAGTYVPGVAALDRLLATLEVDDRTRARLLQACDPVRARLTLCHTRLGPPIGPGAIIRGMRSRRGTTQADLAREVSVTQATIARWESGDLVPSPEALHSVAFALGASVDEAVALAQAQGEETSLVPWSGGEFDLTLGYPQGHPLTEVVALGLEAELWHRATLDPIWEPYLCGAISARVTRLYLDGRFEEVGAPARQAIHLAATPESRLAATYSVAALAAIDRRQGGPADRSERVLSDWLQQLPESSQRAWMMICRAFRLVKLKGTDAAVDAIERAAEMESRFASRGAAYAEFLICASRCEIELAVNRPERALAALDGSYRKIAKSDHTSLSVRAGHALGQAASEEVIEAIRPKWHEGVPPVWLERHIFDLIERDQQRMLSARSRARSSPRLKLPGPEPTMRPSV